MDETEKWLKEHDPEYENSNKLEYGYHNNRRMQYLQKKEIPVSNVFSLGIREVIA